MKNIITRISREPALVLGVVTSGLSLLVLFGLPISGDQMAGIGVFLGAVFGLTRFLTTPTSEVIASQKPGGQVVGGGRIPELKNEPVEVGLSKSSEITGWEAKPALDPPMPVDPFNH